MMDGGILIKKGPIKLCTKEFPHLFTSLFHDNPYMQKVVFKRYVSNSISIQIVPCHPPPFVSSFYFYSRN